MNCLHLIGLFSIKQIGAWPNLKVPSSCKMQRQKRSGKKSFLQFVWAAEMGSWWVCSSSSWVSCSPDDSFKKLLFPALWYYLFSGCQRWAHFLQSLSQRWCWHCSPHLGPTSPAWSLSWSPPLWQHWEYLGWGQMPRGEWHGAAGNAHRVFFKFKILWPPWMCFYSRRWVFPR